MNSFYVFLSTGFGVGTLTARFTGFLRQKFNLPVRAKWSGAGYFGSLEGLIFCVFLARQNAWLVSSVLILATLVSVYISEQAEKELQTHDDPSIVIDEIVGMLWAGAFLPWTAVRVAPWIVFVAVLVLFRIFDVSKLPWRGAQQLPGGWGIVIDDVLAGMLANLVLQIVLRL